MFKLLSAVIFVSLLSLLSQGHAGESAVKVESIKVADHIYMITGQGGNIGLAVDDQYTLLIDDQFANLSDAIKAEIASISDKPIAYLLNTHFHYDHTSGNTEFSDSVGVIVAHENVRERLKNGTTIKAFGKVTEPLAPGDLPALTFNDRLTIHQAHGEVELIHFQQGHTDGDTAVYFKEANVIHTGDLYFSGAYPFIDTSNGGDIHGYIKAQSEILALCDADTKLIPGHGPLADKADLMRDYEILQELVGIVESALRAGGTLETILEDPAVMKYDASHGAGFLSTAKFIEILIDGLD